MPSRHPSDQASQRGVCCDQEDDVRSRPACRRCWRSRWRPAPARKSPPPPSWAPSRTRAAPRCPAPPSRPATWTPGFNRTVPSNEVGAYRLEFLPIGSYVVEVALSGFKTATRSGIVLQRQRHGPRGRVARDRRPHRDGDRRGRGARRQHGDRRDLEDDRGGRHREPADRRPQRLLAAGPHARRAVEQQRRRVRLGRPPARSASGSPSSARSSTAAPTAAPAR